MATNLAITLTAFVTLALAWAVAVASPPRWMACEAILVSAAALVIRELRSLRGNLAPVPSGRTAEPLPPADRSGQSVRFSDRQNASQPCTNQQRDV